MTRWAKFEETESCTRRHVVATLTVLPLGSLLGCGSDDAVANRNGAPDGGRANEDAGARAVDSRAPAVDSGPKSPYEISVERFVAAYNAHDLEGVLSFFSDDAAVEVNAAALADRDALRAFFVEYGATDGPTPYTSAQMLREATYYGDGLVLFMGRILGVREGTVSGFPALASINPIACGFLCEFAADGRCATCRIFLNWGALLPTPV